jgi:tRNA threonylcarbamoyl adenosine modification protein YjeE
MALAHGLYGGLLLLLMGDLGAGKTLLIRSIGRALGVDGIKSPTFAIESVHSLPGRDYHLVHADLYRLDDSSEMTMQFEERLDDGCIVAVEWGERWVAQRERDRWDIRVRMADDSGVRAIDAAAYGERALESLSRSYLRMPDAIIAGTCESCR